MTAFVVRTLESHTPTTTGNAAMMRGNNESGVSWVDMCSRARDRRADLPMCLLRSLQIERWWCHLAKHISGKETIVADGIPR